MNAVHRILGLLSDSPNYGRDRDNLLTGFTIGTAGLLLNGAVLMLVLPFLVAPDMKPYSFFTDNVEFGQLLALILLGGASAFATLLIPLRLVTVFWEPRVGRYFDQIVLSGISPLRFLIGKATSQNLYVGLILFLLLPYFVLSITLGGVNLGFFAAGVLLVWLYCMSLALVTLWLSLYLNELAAATLVFTAAAILSSLGFIPMRVQPFVMTPFPALVHPLYTSVPDLGDSVQKDFLPIFFASVVCMSTLIFASLLAIYLGPLYGIIRENSTFGEVVRAGDSKWKRWFRIRQHIQRSSEIAFFYKNRSSSFLQSEGLIRWSIGFFGLVLLCCVCDFAIISITTKQITNIGPSAGNWICFEFHALCQLVHGLGLALAVVLFSHAKNTTYLRLPFIRGKMAEVSKLDTVAFLLYLMFSTAASITTAYLFERYVAFPIGRTIFGTTIGTQQQSVDLFRTAVEGALVISIAGLVVYALQRYFCLLTWMRSVTFMGVATMYLIGVNWLPTLIGLVFLSITELRQIPICEAAAPLLAVVSPTMVLYALFSGNMGPPFPATTSFMPFYLSHFVMFGLLIVGIRAQGRKLRGMYLPPPVRESVDD